MIKDDFTNLETGASCYAISNSTTIYSYKGGTRTTYIQISGKWQKTTQSAYNNIPSGTTCYSYSEITQLSSYSYMEPIYQSYALLFSLFLLFFCCWLMFRQVFKRKL